MKMPGFTAEAVIYTTGWQTGFGTGDFTVLGLVPGARPKPNPIDEDIVAACGPCRCRKHGSGVFVDWVCSKTCCFPREGRCESLNIPCGLFSK
jgi:hypothetical protein